MSGDTSSVGTPVDRAAQLDSERWGLALSGGGSRAMAFHRGTVQALIDLKLLPGISVVSTVSGGSVFGAAWMAHRADNLDDMDFLRWLGAQLERGFVARSVWRANVGLLRLLLPGYNRTSVLAGFFDREICRAKRLSDLPSSPRLCINATVLNHGQVGKFTREGFSTSGLSRTTVASGAGVERPDQSITLGAAAAASAAFPIGLPPMRLELSRWFPEAVLDAELKGLRALELTDGGVLENLGFQTLWKSRRFGTWNFVVSDAGVSESVWHPDGFTDSLAALASAVLSPRHLIRTIEVMNAKQNRWTREMLYQQVERSLLERSLIEDEEIPDLPAWKAALGATLRPRRRLLLVRVNQTLGSVLARVPGWRLLELGRERNVPTGMEIPDEACSDRAAAVRAYLAAIGVELSSVDERYAALGGDDGVRRVNRVRTHFTALTRSTVADLAEHAYWQVDVMNRIYGS